MPLPQIPLHAFAAMAAFVLGVVQLAAPKGTLPHRTSAGSGWPDGASWRHLVLDPQIRLIGPWSPIHLLSIFTLVMLPLGVWRAHRHEVGDHRRIMILLFSGALIIAGLFTLLPGRIMHAVVFGHNGLPDGLIWHAARGSEAVFRALARDRSVAP